MKNSLLFSGLLVCALLMVSSPVRAAMMPSHDFGRDNGYQDHDNDKGHRGREDRRPVFTFSHNGGRDFGDDRRSHNDRRDSRLDPSDFLRRFANMHRGHHHGHDHFQQPVVLPDLKPETVVAQTPLPAALPLFGAGLAGLTILRRRSVRKDV